MRSNSGCIKAAATLAILLGAGAAQAALVHTAVTGTWDGLHTWNPGQNGDPLIVGSPGGGPGMTLNGWMEYDSVTGQLQNLYIAGTTWIGKWDPAFNDVRMQNYAWQSSGTNLNLLPGAARLACDRLNDGVFVTGASTACGAGYQNGQGTLNLLVDFTGVIDDGSGGITAGAGAGTFLPAQVGFSGTVVGGAVSVYAIKGYNPFIPLAADSTFNLVSVVPVPGAVWLFGSAIGLLGWARRKSATA